MSGVLWEFLKVFLTATATYGAIWFFTRKKTKQEIRSMVVSDFQSLIAGQDVLVKSLQEELARLKNQEKRWEVQYNECEQREGISQVRLKLWERRMKELNIPITNVQRFSVFVLDDMEVDRLLFEKKLSQLPNVSVETFETIAQIRSAVINQPDILVLDYKIDHETIDEFVWEIIRNKEFNPKMIVVSGMPEGFDLTLDFRHAIWKFYSKRGDYINQSVNQIVNYINETIK